MATNSKFIADIGIKTDSDLQIGGNTTIDGNATVSGNLTVNGTSTTINATTTSVEDNMLELANANTSSDTLDIGIYGNYDDGLSDGGATEYTGLFRDASDSTWKLFDGLEVAPTTTVNTSGTGYTLADLTVGDLTATTLTATNGLTGSSITYPTSDGTNGQVITTNGSGTLSFADSAGGVDGIVSSATATAITIDSSENVAIGSSTANKKFNIADPNQGGETLKLHFEADSALDKWAIYAYDRTNSHYADMSFGQNAIAIKGSNSNVGIGTTSPSALLHINSTSQANNRLAIFESDINNLNEYSSISVGSSTLSATFGMMLLSSDTAYVGVGSSGNAFDPTTGSGLYVNANGNCGIGTSSPADTLHVKKSSTVVSEAILTVEGGSGGYGTGISFQSTLTGGSLAEMAKIVADGEAPWNTTASTQDAGLRFFTTGDGTSAERMRLNNHGDAHIGLNNNDIQLFLGSVGGAFGGNSTNNVRASDSNLMLNTPGQFIVEKSGSLGLLMDTDKTFYVRPATSSDNFGMYVRTSNSADTGIKIGRTGTNNAEMGIKVSSNGSSSFASLKFAISDATSWSSDDWFKLKVSGEMDGNFNDTSDQNLKENIVSIPNGDLAKVMQLNPVTFDWKNEVSRNDQTGFIAQEVETIFPNEVLGDAYDVEVEGSGKSINTIGLLSHTVKALQEMKTLIDTLEARIETLESA